MSFTRSLIETNQYDPLHTTNKTKRSEKHAALNERKPSVTQGAVNFSNNTTGIDIATQDSQTSIKSVTLINTLTGNKEPMSTNKPAVVLANRSIPSLFGQNEIAASISNQFATTISSGQVQAATISGMITAPATSLNKTWKSYVPLLLIGGVILFMTFRSK